MMDRINLVMFLEKLEELIDNAPGVPLTGKVLVDSDEILELVDKIRESIPEEVKRAELVSSERERVISEGQQKAERVIAQAEEYAARLVRESEIYRQAEQEAKRIVEEARRRAREMEEGAEEYADQVLTSLQQSLEKTLSVVNKGREQLSKTS